MSWLKWFESQEVKRKRAIKAIVSEAIDTAYKNYFEKSRKEHAEHMKKLLEKK